MQPAPLAAGLTPSRPLCLACCSQVPGRWRTIKAHGRAVGLPSDDDMGNSEVGAAGWEALLFGGDCCLGVTAAWGWCCLGVGAADCELLLGKWVLQAGSCCSCMSPLQCVAGHRLLGRGQKPDDMTTRRSVGRWPGAHSC